MLNVDIRDRANIVIVTPDGPIKAADIGKMAEQINGYINEHDRVPNLVIVAKSLPHWSNFEALGEHLNFVKNHHQIVRKVALVSDSKLLWLARTVVDRFTGAKVRRFTVEALDDAVAWAEIEEDHPGGIVEIGGLPDDVIGLDFKGLITSRDYTETLVPLVTNKIKKHDKIKLICVLGDYFDGYSAGAMWDDLRFGLGHLATFSKLALVTDEDWIRHGAKFFGSLMRTEIMVFHNSELGEAKSWIMES
jgi:hypothetical protein